MNDRSRQDAMPDIEAALADLATVIAFPPTPDLASAVRSRLLEPMVAPRPRSVARPLRRSLVLAAALTLLIVGAALAVRFGLDLLTVEIGPISTGRPSSTASVSTAAPAGIGGGLGLGAASSLDEVRAAAPFEVLVPDAVGAPQAVYLGGADLRGQVSFVYEATDDLPASPLLGGAGLLVTQNHGQPDDGLGHKLVDAGLASVEPVLVDDARGLWISGEPHVFWYQAPDGAVLQGSRRLVGDTLVWERDGLLYRIEGAISLARAMEIALSMD